MTPSNNDESDNCKTIYTKAGKDRVVGEGQFWKSCEDILKNIKGNLEEAGWKCRKIGNFKVEGVND